MAAGAMQEPTFHGVTQILTAMQAGDQRAASELLPLVYDELRKLARARMAKEGDNLTLEPTALVHEAYMRVVGSLDQKKWDHRGHFFGAAAIAMRRILVERARHNNRIKHGGGRARVALHDDAAVAKPPQDETDLVLLDNALAKLEAVDARKAQIVMLRYFAGLSIEETAAAMSLSSATVKNEWAFARAWLHREMKKSQGDEDGAAGGSASASESVPGKRG